MYSRIAGTGRVAASSSSQILAESRQPSRAGTQVCSITRTAQGKPVATRMASFPPPRFALAWRVGRRRRNRRTAREGSLDWFAVPGEDIARAIRLARPTRLGAYFLAPGGGMIA